MTRILYALIFSSLISGCGGHFDAFNTFHISGSVKISEQKNTSTGFNSVVFVEIRDLTLDDSRPDHMRQILELEVRAEEIFSDKTGYSWGASNMKRLRTGEVLIKISADGCDDWRKIYKLEDLGDGGVDLFIKLGEVKLNCS